MNERTALICAVPVSLVHIKNHQHHHYTTTLIGELYYVLLFNYIRLHQRTGVVCNCVTPTRHIFVLTILP